MKIAVMGYGTIGSGVVEVLEINKEKIAKRAGEPIEVKYVLDLREPESTDFQRRDMADREAGSGKEQKKRVATNRIKMDLQS